jgi:hypothetical protein
MLMRTHETIPHNAERRLKRMRRAEYRRRILSGVSCAVIVAVIFASVWVIVAADIGVL